MSVLRSLNAVVMNTAPDPHIAEFIEKLQPSRPELAVSAVEGDFTTLKSEYPPNSAGLADIQQMRATASATIDAVNKLNFDPYEKKVLRTWGVQELADSLGVSRKTVDRHIDNKKLPEGTLLPSNRRVFTLSEMNEIRFAMNRLPHRDPADPPFVMSVTNFKGGVAKTSTTIHLAQYLAFHGYRILVIDADPQGSMTSLFGFRPDLIKDSSKTLADYLSGPHLSPDTWTGTLKTAVQKTCWDQLDIIVANLGMASVDFDLSVRNTNAKDRKSPENLERPFRFYRLLAEGLETVKHDYDVVLIDTPPSLSFMTTNAIFASDGLIIPLSPARLEFDSSASFLQLLAETVSVVNTYEPTPKQFPILSQLVTKYEASRKDHADIHSWLRFGSPDRVLLHPMISSVVMSSADGLTAYERTRWGAGSAGKETLRRAVDALNLVNSEIETKIRECWSNSKPITRKLTAEDA